MVDIRRKSLVCREVWFDEAWSPEGADVVLFYHWSEPVNPAAVMQVHSLELDLSAAESSLWGGFTASTRNQINRAKREGMQAEIWCEPDASLLAEFFEFHRQFTRERGMGESDPEWMHEYRAQEALILTRASDAQGRHLVWHSYFHNDAWVRQLHSVSLFASSEDKELRNQVARANRFLHWADIVEFRSRGFRHFDFGGWYGGNTDEKLLRVNAFKEEFGGTKTQRFHSMQALSIPGRAFLAARRYLGSDGLLHLV